MSEFLMELQGLSQKVEGLDKRIDKQDSILISINGSLIDLAKVSERQVSLIEHIVKINENLEKMQEKIDSNNEKVNARINANHEKITRWSGMGAALGIIAIIVTIYTQLQQ